LLIKSYLEYVFKIGTAHGEN